MSETKEAKMKEGQEILVNTETREMAAPGDAPITRNLSPEEQTEKIAELKALLEEKNTLTGELKEKIYIVDGGKDTANGILFFLENYAQWQYTEAMGVVEVTKIIKAKVEELVEEKDNFLLNSLELEAIFYYLRKSGGTGLVQAQEFIDIVSPVINPIVESLNKAATEKKRVEEEINQAYLDLASAEQGVEVLAEPVAEIEKVETES